MIRTRSSSFRHHQRAFLGAGLAFAIVMLLWNIPQLDFILYPFRLFVTFVHETGHGLAALISGGAWLRFEVFANGAGVAVTGGGNRALILPAGYLGAALFGALLFYIANTVPHSRVISLILGIGVIGISLLYTDFLQTAFFVGLLMGIILIVLGWKVHSDINLIILNVLAMLTGLNAALDLIFLVNNMDAGVGQVRNDAAAFTTEIAPIVPPTIWAILWAALALVMLGASVYFSLIRRRI